jgi:hypothetical protein
MPKGFNLRCAAGKTLRIWLQGKVGALKPGQALVLLPHKRRGDRRVARRLSRAPAAGAARQQQRSCERRITKRSSEGIEHLPPPTK